jgi:hypothetical protein
MKRDALAQLLEDGMLLSGNGLAGLIEAAYPTVGRTARGEEAAGRRREVPA